MKGSGVKINNHCGLVCFTKALWQRVRTRSNGGFTLIEVSIVLMIIALLAGAMLAGQHLINSAAIQGTISQIGKYNSAVHTFYTKYDNSLPGDMRQDLAGQLGFFQMTKTNVLGQPAAGTGDGDGELKNCEGSEQGLGEAYVCGETLVFWLHLFQAGLIDWQFLIPSDGLGPGGEIGATMMGSNIGTILPPAKTGHKGYFTVSHYDARSLNNSQFRWSAGNAFSISAFMYDNINTSGNGNPPSFQSDALTPMEAYTIDTKIDDGFPYNGRMIVFTLGSYNNVTCMSGPDTSIDVGYNLTPTSANTVMCTPYISFDAF